MKEIIAKELSKLKMEIEEFFEKDEISLEKAEVYFVSRIGETVRSLLTACYEQKDAQLLSDKAGRKEAGLVVERRGEVRQVVTQLGMLPYHRTYYACHSGGYCYPICKKCCVEQDILLKKHRISLIHKEILCFLTLYLTTFTYEANFSICCRFSSIDECT